MTVEDNGAKGEQGGAGNGNPSAAPAATQKPDQGSADANGSGGGNNPPDMFAELGIEPETRDWLLRRNLVKEGDSKEAVIKAAAKLAREQDKLLGKAIVVPDKDATPEQREEFLNKLGRPPTPDEYKFKVPDNLPENLPYDGDRAKSFATLAHKVGLTAEQATAIHDWATGNAVEDFNGMQSRHNAELEARAKAETDKLVKLWGPLDGETARANLMFADKALMEAGGDEAIAELKRAGFIADGGKDGEQKIVLSAPIAIMLAKLGQAIYREGEVLKGTSALVNNPFADGETFNLTNQMAVVKQNRPLALSMIAAAGKKPEDFGLKA